MKKLTTVFLFVLAFVSATCAQAVTGKVVEVLDARTLVIETSAGRVKIQLQYIEVPAEGQPLYAIAKDHLSKLTLGKSVEHKTRRLLGEKSIGPTITFDGVDLSLQMMRDGAAWHEPSATSDQSANEAADYSAIQELAKNEKRGIWSVPGLKPPWEVRAENERLARAEETATRLAHPTPVGLGTFHSDTRRPSGRFTPASTSDARVKMDAWVNVFAGADKEPFGLLTYSDPQKRFTAVYTSALLTDFVSAAGKERLECRVIMIAPTLNVGGSEKLFLLGFRAISDDYKFSKGKTRMTVNADNQRMYLGAPHGIRADTVIGVEEIMYYRLTWAQLKKIGIAKKVDFRIDGMTATLTENAQALFKELATATE
jgi:endonuclease YncB( thermonuclease family)